MIVKARLLRGRVRRDRIQITIDEAGTDGIWLRAGDGEKDSDTFTVYLFDKPLLTISIPAVEDGRDVLLRIERFAIDAIVDAA